MRLLRFWLCAVLLTLSCRLAAGQSAPEYFYNAFFVAAPTATDDNVNTVYRIKFNYTKGTQQAIDGDWPMGWGLSFEKPEQMSLYNTTDEIREIGFVNDNRVFYHSTVSSGTLAMGFWNGRNPSPSKLASYPNSTTSDILLLRGDFPFPGYYFIRRNPISIIGYNFVLGKPIQSAQPVTSPRYIPEDFAPSDSKSVLAAASYTDYLYLLVHDADTNLDLLYVLDLHQQTTKTLQIDLSATACVDPVLSPPLLLPSSDYLYLGCSDAIFAIPATDIEDSKSPLEPRQLIAIDSPYRLRDFSLTPTESVLVVLLSLPDTDPTRIRWSIRLFSLIPHDGHQAPFEMFTASNDLTAPATANLLLAVGLNATAEWSYAPWLKGSVLQKYPENDAEQVKTAIRWDGHYPDFRLIPYLRERATGREKLGIAKITLSMSVLREINALKVDPMQTKLQFATWNLTAWTNETGSYSNWTTYFNSGRISFLHSFFETDGEVETAYKTVKIGKYGGVKFSIEIEGWAMQGSSSVWELLMFLTPSWTPRNVSDTAQFTASNDQVTLGSTRYSATAILSCLTQAQTCCNDNGEEEDKVVSLRARAQWPNVGVVLTLPYAKRKLFYDPDLHIQFDDGSDGSNKRIFAMAIAYGLMVVVTVVVLGGYWILERKGWAPKGYSVKLADISRTPSSS